jgi:hypothetical protein
MHPENRSPSKNVLGECFRNSDESGRSAPRTLYMCPYSTSHIFWQSDRLHNNDNTTSGGSIIMGLSHYWRIWEVECGPVWRLFLGVLTAYGPNCLSPFDWTQIFPMKFLTAYQELIKEGWTGVGRSRRPRLPRTSKCVCSVSDDCPHYLCRSLLTNYVLNDTAEFLIFPHLKICLFVS